MVARKEASGKCYAVVHVPGYKQSIAGASVSSERTFRLDIPRRFKPEAIERIQKDCEGVAAILRRHPREAAELLEAAASNDFSAARKIAGQVGLTEKAFVSRGGGLVGWVIGAVVVATILVLEGEANGDDNEVPLFEDIEIPTPP